MGRYGKLEGVKLKTVRIPKAKKLLVKSYVGGDLKSKVYLGPIGIGKSVMVREASMKIAEKLGLEFVRYTNEVGKKIVNGEVNPKDIFLFYELDLVFIDPVELTGRLTDVGNYVMYKPLLWAEAFRRCRGILFLDEINIVQRLDTESAEYRLLLDKCIGNDVYLNDEVMIVGAGNFPEDVDIANEFLSAVIDRVDLYKCESATVDEWKAWMDSKYGNAWDKDVYAFLKLHPEYFVMKPKAGRTLEKFATPRGWTDLAVVLGKGVYDEDEIDDVVVAKIGVEAGVMFAGFKRIKVPRLDEVLSKPSVFGELNTEAKYLLMVRVVNEMREVLNGKEFMSKAGKFVDRYGKFLKWLHDNDREMLSVLIAMADTITLIKIDMIAKRSDKLRFMNEYCKKLLSKLKKLR